MDQEQTTIIGIIVAIVIAVLFFGGWYLYFGQIYNQAATEPVTATSTQELPAQQ